jgi:hypothetical protein
MLITVQALLIEGENASTVGSSTNTNELETELCDEHSSVRWFFMLLLAKETYKHNMAITISLLASS